MNIFEQATRQQLRFSSVKGLLTTEDLWQLPLQSKSSFDLDTVAKTVNSNLKATAEESFVTAVNQANSTLTLALDVVKHVIAVKLAENEKTRQSLDRAAERQKILGILADKKDASLKEMTTEQLAERLATLSD